MALVRRWSSFLVIGAVFIFVFYRLRSPITTPGAADTTLTPTHPHSSVSEPHIGSTKFLWKDIPIQNKVTSYIAYPSGNPQQLSKIQHDFSKDTGPQTKIEKELREKRQAEVRNTAKRAWAAYREYAWLQDELDPINGGGKNTFGGWAATLIDSLDTLWIMDLKDEFHEAVKAVKEVDFSSSSQQTVNIFETTIRHLGGLLAAYDLSKEKILLAKAIEVGDMIYKAFDTPNHMPVARWNWAKAAAGTPQTAPEQVLVAELGSLTMEFTHLTQATGDKKYYDAVARIMDVFQREQNNTLLPGMWPVAVNAKTEDFKSDNAFTLAAMADSAYEYLPKMHALLGGIDARYESMYRIAMDTAIKHTLFRPMTPDESDILVSGFARPNGDSVKLDPQLQHLVCYTGGLFAIGGKLFDIPEHVRIAQKLTNACIWAYKAFPYGIMPEVSHLVPCASMDHCPWAEEVWRGAVLQRSSVGADNPEDVLHYISQSRLPEGIAKVDDGRYILRPEAIESVFVMYRVTGEQSMQAAAWDMFTAIQKHTATDIANSAIADVTAPDTIAPKAGNMESFWIAETLKYFYLIFSDPSVISLDEYVFNTEAHPYRRPV
ncbi:class I alpha-mannosidase-like protein [Pseudovirgaria hyperparasitica]|uniref:alpha-1,2-Mannosidase n=1 Tax=Pseudovirgaria hyperparasitica TaxID=470096 RepID=A0A6A6WAX0_9PEZI|nr:class I alpha-mannosidase-like protein [Pseudovirgaria hyperparasitica]KAF2758271.1 class I alpha-mannosidase-like protein [Pseudovirgaria hyperparasitica]